MNKKALLVGLLVVVIAFLNQYLNKYLPSGVEIPKSVAQDVADYVLPEEELINTSTTTYLVTHIIDGDTIDVDIEGLITRVRYIGINTPENALSGKEAECYAYESTERNRELVEGKYVYLSKDVSEVDKYNRLLRYVYVGNELVNLSLVTEGFAAASTFPPDVSKADLFIKAEKSAKELHKGLWGDICN